MSTPKKGPGEKTTRERLDEMGVDALCAQIIDGKMQREICRAMGIAISSLVDWIAADEERQRRVKEARQWAARAYDEEAEQQIRDASEPFELARAKELAHHLRWKATKVAPKDYGDKVDLNHSGETVVRVKDYTGRKKDSDV
jgi:hypothetical protein